MFVSPTFVVSHCIAGITFRTEADIDIPRILQPPFALYQVANTRADAFYRIRELDSNALPLSPLNDNERKQLLQVVNFPQYWLDRPVLNNPAVRKKIEACLDYPEQAFIDLRWGRVTISNFLRNELDYFYPADSKGDFAKPAVSTRYRNSFARFFPNFSAVMLHGAGVIRNGVALLFMAPDEGGKSSLMQLAGGMPVLSDDQIILRRQDGLIDAHGSPFAPISSGSLQSKLGGVFFLEKSSRFAISPISISEILQFIWREHTLHWFVMPKNLRVQTFELILDACRQAKLFRVQFPKGYMEWDALDNALQGKKENRLMMS